MTRAGFLDTGVLIGYCFTVDDHHRPCKEYVEDRSVLFTSETVEDEYEGARRSVNTRYSDAVRKHLSDVKRSDLEGELGPMDLDRLQTQILDRRNDLYDTLYEFYDQLGSFVQYEEVVAKLEALGRDIDMMAVQRKATLDEHLDHWEQKDEYPEIREELDVHEPDLTICVEGHDLATHLADETELATANPSDFVYDGMREEILRLTEYADVVDLSG